jgi:dolichol-phosphate mannosyltransferase
MLTLNPTHLPTTTSVADRLAPDLSVIIPTYNEAANVPVLVEKLDAALVGRTWDVIFVDDDSPDGTADVVRAIGQAMPHVRCIQRIGRRGLSSAVIEGILSVNAPFVAVMDADLQHDEMLLAPMLAKLEDDEAELVVGSRYMHGGSVGSWSKLRHAASRIATTLSNTVIRSSLSDPMSGFFMVRRDRFTATAHFLSGNGYKILLDFLASSPEPLRIAELPYCFRQRFHGESKLDSRVVLEHFYLLLSKALGKYVPLRPFVLASFAGVIMAAHLALLSTAMRWMPFQGAQFAASTLIVCGYAYLTECGRRREGPLAPDWRARLFVAGTLVISLFVNLSAARLLYLQTATWWLAGGAGAMLGMFSIVTQRIAVTRRV